MSTIEVTPATYDEIAAKLAAPGRQREHLELGGVELHRGPVPPMVLSRDLIFALYLKHTDAHGLPRTEVPLAFARAIEFEVMRRQAQRG